MKRRVIRSSKVAKELCNRGFHIIDISQDRNDYKRTVFVFEETLELNSEIDRILKGE